jgi:hypothetical protein
MAPIWDFVDNRMGQVAYDSLFWNRTKDLSHFAGAIGGLEPGDHSRDRQRDAG